MEAISSINDALEIKGFDGFIYFAEDTQILESSLPENFLAENTGFAVKDILLSNAQVLGNSESTVLLTEKGAWYLAKLGRRCLAILAGYTEAVDIPDLLKVGSTIKKAIEQESSIS